MILSEDPWMDACCCCVAWINEATTSSSEYKIQVLECYAMETNNGVWTLGPIL